MGIPTWATTRTDIRCHKAILANASRVTHEILALAGRKGSKRVPRVAGQIFHSRATREC